MTLRPRLHGNFCGALMAVWAAAAGLTLVLLALGAGSELGATNVTVGYLTAAGLLIPPASYLLVPRIWLDDSELRVRTATGRTCRVPRTDIARFEQLDDERLAVVGIDGVPKVLLSSSVWSSAQLRSLRSAIGVPYADFVPHSGSQSEIGGDAKTSFLLRPEFTRLRSLFVVMWLMASAVAVSFVPGVETPGDAVAYAASVGFFVAAPVVVWRGTQVAVGPEVVAVRRGLGRWRAVPRSDVVKVETGMSPAIVGRSKRLKMNALWTEKQLRDLARALGVPLERPRSIVGRPN